MSTALIIQAPEPDYEIFFGRLKSAAQGFQEILKHSRIEEKEKIEAIVKSLNLPSPEDIDHGRVDLTQEFLQKVYDACISIWRIIEAGNFPHKLIHIGNCLADAHKVGSQKLAR